MPRGQSQKGRWINRPENSLLVECWCQKKCGKHPLSNRLARLQAEKPAVNIDATGERVAAVASWVPLCSSTIFFLLWIGQWQRGARGTPVLGPNLERNSIQRICNLQLWGGGPTNGQCIRPPNECCWPCLQCSKIKGQLIPPDVGEEARWRKAKEQIGKHSMATSSTELLLPKIVLQITLKLGKSF